MRLIRIDDPGDERVELYRNLADGDLTRRAAPDGGLFMAEGELVVRRLIESGRWGVASALVKEERLARMSDALARLPEEAPVYVASRAVVDGVAGFHMHQGCLAVGRRGRALRAEEVLGGVDGGARMVVVMEELANHDNIGGIFRNGAALGAAGALLTERCADPLYRKAIRVSMGAALVVPFARIGALPEGYGALRRAGYTICAMTPARDAVDLREFASGRRAPPARVALVVGAEGPGLSRGAMEAADVRVKIEMAEGADSLNVATASGVAMWAMGRG